jgi:outer membrane lipoprotein-sorting protein
MGGRKSNVRRALILFHVLILLLVGSMARASGEVSNVMEGINRRYGHLKGLSLTYTREVVTRSMSMLGNQARGDLASGKIHFKPPYSLRLEQEKPQSEIVVTNGDTLWWYIPQKKRVYRYPSNKFGRELKLLSDIFSGLAKVEERFRVRLSAPNEGGGYQLELFPHPPWEEIDHIVLTLANGYDIRVVEIYNQLGSITRFTLSDLLVQEKFEKGFFQFFLPEDVQLVEEGGLMNH